MDLLLQADANRVIGAGHVMRCAALGEAWLRLGLGRVAHAGEVTIPFAASRLAQLGIRSARDMSAEGAVMVVDNYDPAARRAWAARDSRLKVAVDDIGEDASGFDVIWNPNAYEAARLYPGFTGEVISGIVPIREDLPRWNRSSDDIAVSLGGQTPPDWLVTAIDTWARERGTFCVTGSADWVPATWKSVPPDQQWPHFARCSMLLTAAGSTVWEAAHVGIPACLIVSAENQRLIGDWATRHGAPVIDVTTKAAPGTVIDALRRHGTSAAALPHINNGAPQVARRLLELANA